MTITCDRFDDALASGDDVRIAEAQMHALTCSRCAETLQDWRDISAAARTLRRHWDSPALRSRIHAEIGNATERRRAIFKLAPLAVAATVLLLAGSSWWMLRPAAPRIDSSASLLGQQALEEVERREADYVRAIEQLSALVAPTVESGESTLLLAYREKLLLLDAAIADCQEGVDNNRFNAHLRRELLAMYQAKRETLERIIHDAKTAL